MYAVAGGGVRSNLHSAEALYPTANNIPTIPPLDQSEMSTAARWQPAGQVAEARHAVSACNTGDWGIYAVGGWANGNVCTGAVDFLDLRKEDVKGVEDTVKDELWRGVRTWKSLAPLNVPRKLHAVAGLPDGRLFVFGGRVSDEARVGPIRSAERYDPAQDRWRPAADLPCGACACAASDAGAVYVMTWGASSEGQGWVKGSGGGNAASAAAAGGGGSEKQRDKKVKKLKRAADRAAAAAAAVVAVAAAEEQTPAALHSSVAAGSALKSQSPAVVAAENEAEEVTGSHSSVIASSALESQSPAVVAAQKAEEITASHSSVAASSALKSQSSVAKAAKATTALAVTTCAAVTSPYNSATASADDPTDIDARTDSRTGIPTHAPTDVRTDMCTDTVTDTDTDTSRDRNCGGEAGALWR